ncbi:hypothetical protein EHE22_08980 [Ochrobactrum pseudogrignonense]|uniref:Uncharacterized protein n=1 Tax=Brucella pseudogrignonensis TaxID=419475 RepID=A0A7Y3T3X4_9HYPH|nr:hypothetical protein [Brucella pseudogrignonensis]NNV20557.1 hypothetical protein [Brucella pseudogrignonensis]
MLILGMDIATTTGFAWYDPSASMSTIRTGIITSTGENAEEKAASIATQLVAMIKAERPDFVAIEQPMRNVVMFKKKKHDIAGEHDETTINPNALQLSSLSGAAVAIISAYRIPWLTIPSSTWRSQFLGYGRKPGFASKDWKKAAMERCQSLKIPVKKHDAAEAVGIAFAASGSQQFKMLQRRAA